MKNQHDIFFVSIKLIFEFVSIWQYNYSKMRLFFLFRGVNGDPILVEYDEKIGGVELTSWHVLMKDA